MRNVAGITVPRLMKKAVYLATDVARKIMIGVVFVHVEFSTHWSISYAAILLQFVVVIVKQHQSKNNKVIYSSGKYTYVSIRNIRLQCRIIRYLLIFTGRSFVFQEYASILFGTI
jgi:hypothetical protein